MRKNRLFTKGIALALCGLMAATSAPIPANAAGMENNPNTVIEQTSEEPASEETTVVDSTQADTEAQTLTTTEEKETPAVVTEPTTEVVTEEVVTQATEEATETVTEEDALNQLATAFSENADITTTYPDDVEKVDLYTIDVTSATDRELNDAYVSHEKDELAAWISTLSNEEINTLRESDTYFTKSFQITANICKEDGLTAGIYDTALDFLIKLSKCNHVNAVSNFFGTGGKVTFNTPSGQAIVSVKGFPKGGSPEKKVEGLTWTIDNTACISIGAGGACVRTLKGSTAADAVSIKNTDAYRYVWANLVYHKPAGIHIDNHVVTKQVSTGEIGIFKAGCVGESSGTVKVTSYDSFNTQAAAAQNINVFLVADANNEMIKNEGSTITLQGGSTTYSVNVDGSVSNHTWGDGYTLPGRNPITHTVSFDSGNGQGVPSITVNRAFTGYTGSGNKNAGAGVEDLVGANGQGLTFTSNYEGAKAVTLPSTPTAKKYTISYNTNGGGSVGQTTGSQQFNGWLYPDGRVFRANDAILVGGDVKLVGQWSEPTVKIAEAPSAPSYTVSYNSNGGGAVNSQKVNRKFKTWLDESGTSYTAGDSITLNKDINLKADWNDSGVRLSSAPTAPSYTVSYDSNGGSAVNSQKVSKTFNNWKGSDGKTYSQNSIVKVSKDMTFTADWKDATVKLAAAPTGATHKISYDTDGGSAVLETTGQDTFDKWTTTSGTSKSAGDTVVVTDNITYKATWKSPTVSLASAPIRLGYTFKGWKINGETKTPGTNVALTTNMTATAVWESNGYTIKYDLNGGKMADGSKIPDQSVNYNDTAKITDKIPMKDSKDEPSNDETIEKITRKYEFIGWAVNAGATSPNFTSGQEVKNLSDTKGATITLYAVYKEDKTVVPKEQTLPDYPINPDIDTSKITEQINVIKEQVETLAKVSDLTKTDTDQIKKMIETLFGVDSNIASKLTDFIMSSNLSEEAKLRILNHLVNGYLTEQDKQELINAINSSTLSQMDKEDLLKTIRTFTSLTFEQQKKIIDALNAGSSADFVTGEGVVFVLKKNADGTISVALKDLKGITDLVIPNSITIAGNTYPVTAITPGAFKGNTTLKTVSIPSNVSTIGDSAFENCKNLTTVKTDKGLVTIGNKAFKGCVSLTGFTCPGTVKTIGDSAFEGCVKLAKISLNDGLLKIGKRAFYGCSKLTSVAIPKTVLKVGSYAFAKCKKLKKITFRNYADSQCVTIGDGVFAYNTSLTGIKLPKKITVIPTKAFYKDTKLKSVSGMSGVVTIGTSAFEECKKISKITLNSKVQVVKGKAFYNCKSLKTVKIKSKGLTKVGSKAFKKCKKNITFTVPNSKVDAYNKLLNGKY